MTAGFSAVARAMVRRELAPSDGDQKHALENPDRFFHSGRLAPGSTCTEPGLERQTPFHLRRHDEAETGRRRGAVARWEMGRVRRGRCRSRGEHEDFAFV